MARAGAVQVVVLHCAVDILHGRIDEAIEHVSEWHIIHQQAAVGRVRNGAILEQRIGVRHRRVAEGVQLPERGKQALGAWLQGCNLGDAWALLRRKAGRDEGVLAVAQSVGVGDSPALAQINAKIKAIET